MLSNICTKNTLLAVDTSGERLLLVWDRCVLLDKLGHDPTFCPNHIDI